jgi:hypothetical protein
MHIGGRKSPERSNQVKQVDISGIRCRREDYEQAQKMHELLFGVILRSWRVATGEVVT